MARGDTTRADVARLCERVRVLLEDSGARVLVCDVGALVAPDAGTVEALARVALTARRLGREVRLRHASRELRELLALAGLCSVVPVGGVLPVGRGGQAEEREEARGVEEEADPDDPAG